MVVYRRLRKELLGIEELIWECKEVNFFTASSEIAQYLFLGSMFFLLKRLDEALKVSFLSINLKIALPFVFKKQYNKTV